MFPNSPDGGYGWVVVLFAFISQAFTTGITWSGGVFYVLFLNNINSNEEVLAMLSSLIYAVLCLTGPLSAILTKRYGCRTVHIVGGFITSAGFVMSAFVENPYLLVVSFGLVAGAGFGLCFIPSVDIVSMYFNKRRPLAMGLSISGAGMGILVFPTVIRLLYDTYGYKGAVVLTGGICLNLIVCGVIFRPLDEQGTTKDPNIVKEDSSESGKHKGNSSLNLHIFKNVIFILFCLNNLCSMFGCSIFTVHFAAYAATLGHSETSCAMLYSGMGISSFVCRVLYSFIGLSPRIRTVYYYIGIHFFAGLIVLIAPFVREYYALMIFSICFGMFTAVFTNSLPLLIVEYLSLDMLPIGFGYLLVCEAVGQIIGGPLAGLLYKSTGYYGSSLFLSGGVLILSGAIMIPPCMMKNPQREERAVTTVV